MVEVTEEIEIRSGGGEGCGAHDDLLRTEFQETFGLCCSSNSAADSRCGVRGQPFDHSFVLSFADGSIEVDDLDGRESCEALEHPFGRVCLERFLPALDKLDDFAVHQIDARDDQRATFRTGMLCLS